MKYLLSDGSSTNKIEYYIIDLFKIYFTVYPNDVLGVDSIGFDYTLLDVKKDELEKEIETRINLLINEIKNKLYSEVNIDIVSIELIDETKAKVILDVNKIKSTELVIDI